MNGYNIEIFKPPAPPHLQNKPFCKEAGYIYAETQ
jgi:hypothetical protein